MKINKIFIVSMLTVLLVVAIAFSGCSNANDPAENSSATNAPAEDSENIAEDYPKSPITIIVPWSSGGRSDTFTRAVAMHMEENLGQSVIVSNEPGGSGISGTYTVVQSKADGYTMGNFSTTHLFSYYLKNPNFPLEQLTPVGAYAEIYQCLVAKADKGWDDFNDFLEDAVANPGKYMHGNTGVGTDDHIYAASLYAEQGAEVTQMPYDGDAGLVQGLLAGEVDVAMIALPSIASYVDSGDLVVLAISSTERLDSLPDAPTFVEQGIDFTETAWNAVFVPKDTPAEVIAVLEEALDYTRNNAEYQKTIENMYANVSQMDSKALQSKITELLPKIEKWIKDLEAQGVNFGR